MNALKHGLDARTLILPGEDESAYKARLEAWSAHYAPRDPLEAALVEQAVGLSWRLDRADRACAAHLAERIRLGQSPESRQERAEAQAALAAEIGDRLLADPPPPKYNLARIHAKLVRYSKGFWAPYMPMFDLPAAQAHMARKRFRMPIPPDDPAHPELLLRRLRSTAAGCTWLIDQWSGLRAALEGEAGWGPAERLKAVRLLAKLPAEALDDPVVRSIYLCCFAMGPKDPQVFDDQVRETADCEFEYFLERMAGGRIRGHTPPGRDAARSRLLAIVDGVIAELQARAALNAEREQAALSSDRLAFDGSPAGRRMRRLQSRLLGSLLRTVNLLVKVRRRPDVAIAAGRTTRNVAATAGETANCEKVRNEPNAGPSPGVGPSREALMTGSEAAAPVELQGPPSVGCTHPTATGSAIATQGAAVRCEEIRNEPKIDVEPPIGRVQPTGCVVPAPAEGDGTEMERDLAATRDEPADCEEIRNEPNGEADRGIRELGRRPEPEVPDRPGGREDADRPVDAGPPDPLQVIQRPMSGLALTSVRG